jgi:hypothetical protein
VQITCILAVVVRVQKGMVEVKTLKPSLMQTEFLLFL